MIFFISLYILSVSISVFSQQGTHTQVHPGQTCSLSQTSHSFDHRLNDHLSSDIGPNIQTEVIKMR